MFISYIKLVNFATIFAGMRKKSIEIDMSKRKHKVVLLIGVNGTGKSAILSNLHPFAYPGNMDVRSGPDLFLENEDGYKEIHIQHGEDKYIIKHHYLFKSGKGVKSFIMRNGVELNSTGSVTVFREIVLTELYIEPEFMRLVRLGRDSAGIIDLKTADRKAFITNLLKEIDVYGRLYKKVNEDSRTLKSVLRSVSEKITKLKVLNEEDEHKALVELENKLVELTVRRNEIQSELGSMDGILSTLAPEGPSAFNNSLLNKMNDQRSILQDIMSKTKDIDGLDVIVVGTIDESIRETTSQIMTLQGEMTLNTNMINFYFNQLNNLHEQKADKENSLKYVASEMEYSQLTEHYLELTRKKGKLDKKFENFKPKCTRNDLLNALSLLQEIENIVSKMNEFSSDAVRDVSAYFLDNQNVDYIVKTEVAKIDNKIDKLVRDNSPTPGVKRYSEIVYVHCEPEGHECHCPFRGFYEDVMKDQKVVTCGKHEAELQALENRREKYLAYLDVAKLIEYINVIIKSNRVLIEKMPENFFDIRKIINSVKDFLPIYDEDHITNYIAMLEDYEAYLLMEGSIKEVQRELEFIRKNSSTLDSLQKELEKVDSDIFSITNDLEKLKIRNAEIETILEVKEKSLSDFREYEVINNEISELRAQERANYTELSSMKVTSEKIMSIQLRRKTIESQLHMIENDIAQVDDAISTGRYRLKQFKDLNDEKNILENKFDEVAILRESLSSTKGIPLLFMTLFMKNPKITINSLLDTVYKGELEVCDFIINESEFRIPYIKNGVTVSDAVKCSDGERSFVSLALSFALMEQTVKDYNIMLLDEIDGPLSQVYRSTFIALLEKQLSVIDAEQVFVITHNNMFDDYPVDVIMTSNENIDNMKNVNILWKAA